jgi:hypothetical protein
MVNSWWLLQTQCLMLFSEDSDNFSQYYFILLRPSFERSPHSTREQNMPFLSQTFNAMGTADGATVTPADPDSTDRMSHFIDTLNDILEYAMYDLSDFDMVGLTIRNDENVADSAVAILPSLSTSSFIASILLGVLITSLKMATCVGEVP